MHMDQIQEFFSSLQSAASEIITAQVRPYGAFASVCDDLSEAVISETVHDIDLQDYIDRDDETDDEIRDEMVNDFVTTMERNCDHLRGNGITYELTPELIYTSDIMGYFMENMNECEEAYEDMGVGDGSITDQISVAVQLQRENITYGLLEEIEELFADDQPLLDELEIA